MSAAHAQEKSTQDGNAYIAHVDGWGELIAAKADASQCIISKQNSNQQPKQEGSWGEMVEHEREKERRTEGGRERRGIRGEGGGGRGGGGEKGRERSRCFYKRKGGRE